jgi:hypothetical protein
MFFYDYWSASLKSLGITGLVVRVKTHVQEVVSSNPGSAAETIYHAPLIWIKSMRAKIVEKVTWHCCKCCNPAKGRVEFEDGWLIKSSCITKDEMKACQLTRTKFPPPQKKKKLI